MQDRLELLVAMVSLVIPVQVISLTASSAGASRYVCSRAETAQLLSLTVLVSSSQRTHGGRCHPPSQFRVITAARFHNAHLYDLYWDPRITAWEYALMIITPIFEM